MEKTYNRSIVERVLGEFRKKKEVENCLRIIRGMRELHSIFF